MFSALIHIFDKSRCGLAEVFSLVVVPDSAERVDDFRRLARRVWQKKADLPADCQVAQFRAVVRCCRDEFHLMAGAVRSYLRDAETVRFVSETTPDDPVGQEFSRQDAVNQVFSPRLHSSGHQIITSLTPYYLLLGSNFEVLRRVHERYYQRPSIFSLP